MQCLGQTLQQAADADLVDHLGQLPAADVAHQAHHPCIGGDHRLGALEELLLAANHHREDSALGAGLAAGNRCIEKAQFAFGGQYRQFASDLRRSGGVVDQQAAWPHTREHAMFAEHHAAQVIVVAHATHHELRPLRRFPRRRRGAAAVLRHPLRGTRGGAIIDAHLMPLALQMPRHGIAHRAKTYECDFCHVRSSR
ncbi:hypothetical protein D3C78_941530 [compost metagenome]